MLFLLSNTGINELSIALFCCFVFVGVLGDFLETLLILYCAGTIGNQLTEEGSLRH